MPYPQFDRSKLRLKPLVERKNDLDLSVMIYPETPMKAWRILIWIFSQKEYGLPGKMARLSS